MNWSEGQRALQGSNPSSTLEKVLTHLRVLMPASKKSGTPSKGCVKAFGTGWLSGTRLSETRWLSRSKEHQLLHTCALSYPGSLSALIPASSRTALW